MRSLETEFRVQWIIKRPARATLSRLWAAVIGP